MFAFFIPFCCVIVAPWPGTGKVWQSRRRQKQTERQKKNKKKHMGEERREGEGRRKEDKRMFIKWKTGEAALINNARDLK